MTGPKGNSEFCFPEPLNVPQGEAEGNIEGREQYTDISLRLYCKISCFAKFLEAFVKILVFAEVCQRSHGIVGRLVSRFGAFIV